MGCGASSPALEGVPTRIDFPPEGSDAPEDVAWRSGTLLKVQPDGSYEMRIDNMPLNAPLIVNLKQEGGFSEDGFERFHGDQDADLEEDRDVKRKLPVNPGDRLLVEVLLVLTPEGLLQLEVVKPILRHANKHLLREESNKRQLTLDLNLFNHCKQTFPSVAEYEEARMSYCKDVVEKLRFVEDAITGNRLSVEDQLIDIAVDSSETATGIGIQTVQRKGWRPADLNNMHALAIKLMESSPKRMQGTHEAQGVLIRANPGTGKTWSLQQLCWIMASELQKENTMQVSLVPMLVRVQRLVKYSALAKASNSKLLLAYIDGEFSQSHAQMLRQAYELRALVVLLDGVDEAASLKMQIEDLVCNSLAPCGIRTVASSRPEGVRLHRYVSSFVIMNLNPLTVEQQQKAVSHQLKGAAVFETLSQLSAVRRKTVSDQPPFIDKEKRIQAISEVYTSSSAKQAYMTLRDMIKATTSAPHENIETELDDALDFFDEACQVPVLLSMLVLYCSGREAQDKLPCSRLMLYRIAIRAALRNRFTSSPENFPVALTMLSRVAVAAHMQERREFDSRLVELALKSYPQELKLWSTLISESSGVPLVLTLELGSDEEMSKFQFKHLSFQEGLMADAVISGEECDLWKSRLWSRGFRFNSIGPVPNQMMLTLRELGVVAGAEMTDQSEIILTEQQSKAMVVLQWQPLAKMSQLQVLSLKRAAISFHAAAPLASLLADSSKLTSLQESSALAAAISFVCPVQIGVETAQLLVASSMGRKGLLFYGQIAPTQFPRLGSADAILVAATLRSLMKTDKMKNLDVDGWVDRASCIDGRVVGSTRSSGTAPMPLSNLLTQAGYGPADFQIPGENHGGSLLLVCLLKLAGFSATTVMPSNFSLSELIAVGFTATELCEAGIPQVQLDGAGLALELVVQVHICVFRDLPMLHVSALNIVVMALKSLVGLRISENRLGVESAKAFASSLKLNSTLTTLSLDTGALPIQQIKGLSGRISNELNLSAVGIGRLGSVVLSELVQEYQESVGVLKLDRNNIGPDGGEWIGKMLRDNNVMQELHLRFCGLKMAGIKAITEALKSNTCLEKLYLLANNLGSEGATSVAEMLKENTTLRLIDVSDNRLSKQSKDALYAISQQRDGLVVHT
ncbi:hypothetical protein AB1Y20_002506 [Prymnesium parvum]|uniref:NACHT domain-containing protein n=1 Tax=Prymnesium parvum TaxID=97485 RepID=A0AB34J9H4_PRYPA